MFSSVRMLISRMFIMFASRVIADKSEYFSYSRVMDEEIFIYLYRLLIVNDQVTYYEKRR